MGLIFGKGETYCCWEPLLWRSLEVSAKTGKRGKKREKIESFAYDLDSILVIDQRSPSQGEGGEKEKSTTYRHKVDASRDPVQYCANGP